MGWEKLIAAREQNRRNAEEEAKQPPVVCPIDGATLQVRADGSRSCPMGNFDWR